MITTVLSDIGNVVAFYDNPKSDLALARLTGAPLPRVHDALFKGEEGGLSLFQRFMRGEMDRNVFRDLVCAKLGVPGASKMHFEEAFGDVFTMNPTVIAEWTRLRADGLRIVAVSNMEVIRFDRLARIGVPELFDEIVLSCEENLLKPSEELLVRALTRARAQPWQAVFIDDQLKNIPPAQRLGIRSHRYIGPEGLKGFLKDVGLAK